MAEVRTKNSKSFSRQFGPDTPDDSGLTNRQGNNFIILMGLGFALVFGLVTFLLWFLDIGSLHATDQLNQSGVSTQAVIVSQKRTPSTNNIQNPNDSYSLVYQFQSSDGKTYTHEAFVNRDVWERTPEGTSVEVRYSPTDPTVTQLTIGENRASLSWLYYAGLIVFGFLTLLGLVILGWGFYRKGRADPQ